MGRVVFKSLASRCDIKQGVHGTGDGWIVERVGCMSDGRRWLEGRMRADSSVESTLNRTATHYFSSEASSRACCP